MTDLTTYQIAVDPNAVVLGSKGAWHITAVGDCAPLCGTDDLTMTEWTDVLTAERAGAILVIPGYPICGKCADEFWGENA
jgi:hypothetical protein